MLQLGEHGLLEARVGSPPRGPIALVRNPASRRNLGGRAWWREFADPELIRAEPESPADLLAALKEFARREVGVLVIDGGDGTVREVLTALPEAFGDRPPVLAVLASGTTNLIAADVGAGRADARTVALLGRVARGGLDGVRLQRRSTLEASWPDGSQPPAVGMFMGAAGFNRATDTSIRLVRQGQIDEGAGIAATFAATAAQILGGSQREGWLKGRPMTVTPPGGPAVQGPRFLFLATTLHRLMLGVWPFWTEPGRDEGDLHWLDIDAPPRRLALALPAVLRGRPRPWMAKAGYRSGASHALDLTLTEPFIMDGEPFRPGPSGQVRLRAGQSYDFIVP